MSVHSIDTIWQISSWIIDAKDRARIQESEVALFRECGIEVRNMIELFATIRTNSYYNHRNISCDQNSNSLWEMTYV